MVRDRSNQNYTFNNPTEDRDYYSVAAQLIRHLVVKGIKYLKNHDMPVGYLLTEPVYHPGSDDVIVYLVRADGFESGEFTGRKAAREYKTKISKKLPKDEFAHIYRYTFDSKLGLILDVREVW